MNGSSEAYQLIFEERPGYLHVLIRADEMDEGIAREYLGDIAKKCSAEGHERVLLERDVPVMLPMGDLFDVTNYFLGLMEGRRVAFVNPHVTIDEDMDLAIMIGKNRGGDYFLFKCAETAEKWLMK